MNFGAIIIGDELLSGKRQDRHFQHVIETLAQRGLELKWCRIIGDDPALIVETLRQTLPQDDIVFCFGGIGATPDDHTRQCAAQAAGVPLYRHPEAVAEIEARFGAEAYPRRILMADLPQGSRIIPNPFNRIPGFSLNHHHFLPGFPQMAWPMMDWVLDTLYPGNPQPGAGNRSVDHRAGRHGKPAARPDERIRPALPRTCAFPACRISARKANAR